MSKMWKSARRNGATIGALALVLLIASTPSMIGLVFTRIDQTTSISLDICHPGTVLDHSSTIVLFAPTPCIERICTLNEARFAPETVPPLVSSLNEAPDPPPPKQRA